MMQTALISLDRLRSGRHDALAYRAAQGRISAASTEMPTAAPTRPQTKLFLQACRSGEMPAQPQQALAALHAAFRDGLDGASDSKPAVVIPLPPRQAAAAQALESARVIGFKPAVLWWQRLATGAAVQAAPAADRAKLDPALAAQVR